MQVIDPSSSIGSISTYRANSAKWCRLAMVLIALICTLHQSFAVSGDRSEAGLSQTTDLPAFPGAEGHGASSIGGRSGKVIKVSNLFDSGPGSLRSALLMSEPRIIVFTVSGTIFLQSPIKLQRSNSYFTLAGQSAPGDGIAIAHEHISLQGVTHAIIRHIRIRHGCPGKCNPSSADGFRIHSGSNHIILDHLSITWTADEVMEIWGSNIEDVTVQWTLMGEGVPRCVDGRKQNLGPLLNGDGSQKRITFTKNYIVHTCYRNYFNNNGQYEFINNLNYNTRSFDFNFSQNYHATGASIAHPDVVGQFVKEGPDTRRHAIFDVVRNESQANPKQWDPVSLFIEDLTVVTKRDDPRPGIDPSDPYTAVKSRAIGLHAKGSWIKRDKPGPQPRHPVNAVPSESVPSKVLPTVGASSPVRDRVDQRLVGDLYKLGRWKRKNVGKYPQLSSRNRREDTDNDGMADAWEINQGLDPTDGTDHKGDINSDGYTNIENYINGL